MLPHFGFSILALSAVLWMQAPAQAEEQHGVVGQVYQASASGRAIGRLIRQTRTVETSVRKLGTGLKGGVGES